MTQARAVFRCKRFVMVGGMALVFAAAPVTIAPDLASIDWQTAHGKGNDGGGGGPGGGGGNGGGGPGGGHGGGHGNGHANGHGDHGPGQRDHGAKGHGYAHGRGGGHGHGQPSEYGSVAEFKDAMRSGKAFGLDRRDERVEQARERYQTALSNGRRKGQQDAAEFGVGQVAHRFTPEEAKSLIERGWKAKASHQGHENHGERVRTMVELSKRLGYGARVGAMQANFGTPHENGIADRQSELEAAAAELEAARNDPARADEVEDLENAVADLEAELDAAIAAAKPGLGPDDSWATADLDVNDDGAVDTRDLEALDAQAQGTTAPSEPAA